MVDVEDNQEMDGSLPSIRAEGAMFVLVLLGSVFIALGFVSTSAYHYAMGFPPALFPPDSALLGLMGFVYGIPAICLVAVTPLIGLVGWKAGKKTWFKNIIVERVKKSKILQGTMLIILFLLIVVINVEEMGLLDIPALIVFLLSAVVVFSSSATIADAKPVKFGMGSWLMLCFVFVALSLFVIQGTAGIAAYFGRQEVAAILAEKEPRFPTVIPLVGGSYKPGKLIVCSERFCGFHDGLNPKIVSLDGIREIVP